MTIADCFCGGVAAMLVCTFLIEIVQSRQRSQLLLENNLILQVQATGYGPAAADGRRVEYPVAIIAELLLPNSDQQITGDIRTSIPEDLLTYSLRGTQAWIPKDFCEEFNPPREIENVIYVAFRKVNTRRYPRCILTVRPHSSPPGPVEYIRFRGFLMDPARGTVPLDEAMEKTLSEHLLRDELKMKRTERGEIQTDIDNTFAGIRLYLRCDLGLKSK